MIGLFYNDVYSLKSSLKTSTILSIATILLSLTMDGVFATAFLAVPFGLFFECSTKLTVIDVNCKWNKFQLTLPVTKKDIVTAKYLSFIFLMMCSLIVVLVGFFLHKIIFSNGINEMLFIISFGFTTVLIASAVSHPLLLLFGTINEKLISFFSIMAGAVTQPLLGIITQSSNYRYSPTVCVISVLIAIVLLVISYFCSLSIYNKNGLIK